MSVTGRFFGRGLENLLEGSINWVTDNIRVALFTDAITPAPGAGFAAWQNAATGAKFFNYFTAGQVVGAGYTAGGASLGSKTRTWTLGTPPAGVLSLGAAATVWTSASITARYAIIYEDTGTPSTSSVLGFIDFGQNMTSSNGDFRITWNAGGVFTLNIT